MRPRLFSTIARRCSHENPLGLPPKAPPGGKPSRFPAMMARGLPTRRPLPDVRKVLAVSSAKGGVGKSTIAVNLALAFARQGKRTGLLDADIFGPSVPTLLNLSGEPRITPNGRLVPLVGYGVKSMSMGYLVPDDAPVVWRGLMVQKALQQLLHEVDWGGLDVLVLDLPPGTGDVQLTITQQIEVHGALIVSTPQSLSLKDSIKGINMFRKVEVPILGMVQNMSLYQCPGCGHEEHVFGHDGVRRACEELDIRLLADVPLNGRICADADKGKPTVVAEPESKRAKVFHDMAEEVAKLVDLD